MKMTTNSTDILAFYLSSMAGEHWDMKGGFKQMQNPYQSKWGGRNKHETAVPRIIRRVNKTAFWNIPEKAFAQTA